ncbi:MAG: NADH-quinone oxidoreductase subunit N [Armatimonadota bacterium]|nr:NADH-quinone oxidoreductase subunit N [Armatimonadota bacterium]MDR7438810.1 NADH-quinone oxidoreductase subunit N [Armatimonadota bacterium]MDR7562094.1 NADH-quinone oxidoreductase subunit N [Armatimonadota bacterium]MDR7567894.1 NADH-quinone oxidoreductase subunit N [Armatimonadota bacterium]MDR7601940.1 NADH-quinone oxidoreductase subunit N [Armatimonadota bacterium]
MNDLRTLLPEILVATAATAVLFADLPLRTPVQRRLLLWLSLGGVFLALWATLSEAASTAAFDGMIIRDGLTRVFRVLVLGVAAVGLVLSRDYLVRTGLERGEYYALLLFSAVGAQLLAASRNLLLTFLALELLSVPLYVLAAFARHHRSSQEAGLKYFLLGSFASGVFLYGMALVYGQAGTLDLARLGGEDGLLLRLGAGLLLVGLAYKAAVVPFHAWAPDVYEGSPMPAAAYMSVIAKVGAIAALARLIPLALPGLVDLWRPFVAVLSAMTMVVGNLGALWQRNLKRMLAYSSIAHAGYLLMGLAAGTATGLVASAYYLAAYALMQLGAFGVLVLLERMGLEADEVQDLGGLGDRSPALAAAFVLFMASLVGIPPTAGFVGKFYLFTAALEAGLGWLALVGVATSVVSVAYYLRAAYAAYADEGRPGVRVVGGWWAGAGVAVAALGVLLGGVVGGPVIRWVHIAAGVIP